MYHHISYLSIYITYLRWHGGIKISRKKVMIKIIKIKRVSGKLSNMMPSMHHLLHNTLRIKYRSSEIILHVYQESPELFRSQVWSTFWIFLKSFNHVRWWCCFRYTKPSCEAYAHTIAPHSYVKQWIIFFSSIST